MHSDVPANDLYAIRLGYSASLIRLVNELLDSVQTGKNAAPLHALALVLDLPGSFVEVRHAATHEVLPSIYVLRELCRRSLDWLYENFWKLQQTTALEYPQDTKQLFSIWRRSRRAHVMGPVTSEETQIIQGLCTQFYRDPTTFYKVLLDKNILVPADTTESDSARKSDIATTLWGPALVAMGNDFCVQLAIYLGQTLDKVDWQVGVKLNFRTIVLVTWLVYLVEHLGSSSPQLEQQLGSKPRPWNAQGLAACYRKFKDPKLLAKADKMARFTLEEIKVQADEAPVIESKWNRVSGWTPRPIGI